MPTSTIGLDSTTIVLFIAMGLGGLGLKRGIRSEGITLSGVLGAAVVFGSDGMRERLIRTVNKIPRVFDMLVAPDTTVVASSTGGSAWFKTPDEKLVFFVVFFFVSVGLFYYVGSKYGSDPVGRIERIVGGIMGAVSGFAIGFTGMGFSQSYVSRHPNTGGMTFTLPSIQTPSLPVGNTLAQYAPLVFLVAIGIFAVLAITSFRKAKQ